MPSNDILQKLDTTKVAGGFNDFLASQGLGNMNPSTSRRYRAGIEASPMDEILALNGFNFDEVFKKIPPEPEPLASLNSINTGTQQGPTQSEAAAGKAAIASLGLSDKAVQTLESLLKSGGSTSVGELPAPLIQLLKNPGVNNATELVQQIGQIYTIIGNKPLPVNKDITLLMLEWMQQLGTDNSKVLIDYLKTNPTRIKEALRDSLTGLNRPIQSTSLLLKVVDAFKDDPIIGSPQNETLLASNAGGSRITGGGGKDFFVISLSSDPFPNVTYLNDFSPSSGSKIVLDNSDYPFRSSYRFAVASNRKSLSKLSKSNTHLIFSDSEHRLFLNGNGRKKGFGTGNGGAVAEFLNQANLRGPDILVFRDNNLFDLAGNLYQDL
jgi:hypothetical protein